MAWKGAAMKRGDRFRVAAPAGTKGQLYHVRGVVDDYVVMRAWQGGRWRYVVEHPCAFTCGLYARDKATKE